MINNGYKNVYNLYGGIFEWCNTMNPVFRNSIQVNEVHAYSKIWSGWIRKEITAIT
jgi:hypothetical protein